VGKRKKKKEKRKEKKVRRLQILTFFFLLFSFVFPDSRFTFFIFFSIPVMQIDRLSHIYSMKTIYFTDADDPIDIRYDNVFKAVFTHGTPEFKEDLARRHRDAEDTEEKK